MPKKTIYDLTTNKIVVRDLTSDEEKIRDKEIVEMDKISSIEAKIKEMGLKYGTQLDTAKIKAEADLDKMIISENSKVFEKAEKSANMFTNELQGLNGQPRPSQENAGVEQIISSETDFRK